MRRCKRSSWTDFVDLLMSRFVPPRIAGVLVIGPILMLPATAVEAPSDSLRSAVCGTDLGSLPVAKARLLDVGDYRGPRHPTMRRLSDSSTRGWYLAGDSILPKQCAPFVQLRNSTDAEAKKIFNEDLKKYPHNCVALAELAAAERTQRNSSRASSDSEQVSAHLPHCPK